MICIGDVAGHLEPLLDLLNRAGVDTVAARIPPHLTVLQVGDLAHRGPHSEDVVRLVDRLIRGNPGQWIQLIGNHEEPYIFDGPGTAIRPSLPDATARIIRSWWDDGLATGAVSVAPDWESVDLPSSWHDLHLHGSILLTHAGLTYGAWRLLGEPPTAREAANAINAEATHRALIFGREGVMTTGIPDLAAGPLWANRGREVLESWHEAPSGFGMHQIHGHTTVRNWQQATWYPGAEYLRDRRDLIADQTKSIEVARVGRHLSWGIDPGHGRRPTARWEALVLTGAHIEVGEGPNHMSRSNATQSHN